MNNSSEIQLVLATIEDSPIIQRIWPFYVYDLGRECGSLEDWECPTDPDFVPDDLNSCFIEPKKTFLIKVKKELAGFIMLDKLEIVPEVDFYLSEFFILGKFQNKGIGREVILKLFNQLKGIWAVGVLPENKKALRFWKKIITEFSGSSYREIFKTKDELRTPEHPDPYAMNIFVFKNNKDNILNTYEKIADWMDEHRSRTLFEKPYLDKAISYLKPGASILDLGCGTGEPIGKYFADAGFHVTGVDGSTKMLEIAKARCPNIKFILGDMRILHLNEKFDCIIAWHSFFHLPQADQRKMFETFACHLNKNGVLLFTSGPEAGEVWSDNGGESLYHASLSCEEYEILLHQYGFKVIEHKISDPECGDATVWLADLSKILSSNFLKDKAYREIDGLNNAEKDLDEKAALDYALNGAFTIFHLLEWRKKENNLNLKINMNSFVKDLGNEYFNVLHDVVTHLKHITVSTPLSKKETSLGCDEELTFLCTEKKQKIISEDNKPMIDENSTVIVYFGSDRASFILKKAMEDFETLIF